MHTFGGMAPGRRATLPQTHPNDAIHMPRIAATKGGAEETTRLMVLMAERITQALTRNSELFRAGRGQMADFANRYGIMATTAKRILEGSADRKSVV